MFAAATANLTNEGWPARTQTFCGAQGSKGIAGIAAEALVSSFFAHLAPSFTLEESGPPARRPDFLGDRSWNGPQTGHRRSYSRWQPDLKTGRERARRSPKKNNQTPRADSLSSMLPSMFNRREGTGARGVGFSFRGRMSALPTCLQVGLPARIRATMARLRAIPGAVPERKTPHPGSRRLDTPPTRRLLGPPSVEGLELALEV